MNCNMMMRSLCCVSAEVRNLPTYDGLSDVDAFLNIFEREVLEHQRFEALKWVLRAMPARWSGIHQGSFEDWRECRRMMLMHFGKPQTWLTDKNVGWNGPRAYLSRWVQPAWMHMDFALGDTFNKHIGMRQLHERPLQLGWQTMERMSV